MKEKSVGSMIMIWAETIIAIRVLLFSIPVIINKYMAKSFVLANLDDRFIAVMSATALLYLITGIASILGLRHWKAVHYVVAFVILALTAGSLNWPQQVPTASVGLHYFYPVIFSIVIAALTTFLGTTKEIAQA